MKKIFEKTQLKDITLKNRLIRSATWEGIAGPDGSVSEEGEGYKHIILAGHSLGANKVIYYLSRHHDPRVDHFSLLSPAILTYMMSGVTESEKYIIREQVERGDGDKMLPFPFMGWVNCIANTAYDWQFSGLLNNVHTAKDGDFSQAEKITHTGALLVFNR